MEDKREKILKAAQGLFLHKGYEPTTIDEVAGKAGIAKGTVYLYFKDKADLYASLLEKRIGALHDDLAAIVASDEKPSTKLEQLILRNMEFIGQRYPGAEFVQDTQVGHDPEILRVLRIRITPRLAELLAMIAGVIQAGIDCGEFRQLDPFDVAVRIFGLVNVNLMRRALDSRPLDIEQEARVIRDFVFNGIATAREES